MTNKSAEPPGRRTPSVDGSQTDSADKRWRLIGDVALFQGKLLLDNMRDLVLGPVAIGAALVGIVTSRDEPGRHFYRLMRWGRWSDHAINLFNVKGAPESDSSPRESHADGPNIDQLADEVERVLIERYSQSTLAKAAKGSIDRGLDSMNFAPSIDRKRLHATARRIIRGLMRAGPGRGKGKRPANTRRTETDSSAGSGGA